MIEEKNANDLTWYYLNMDEESFDNKVREDKQNPLLIGLITR